MLNVGFKYDALSGKKNLKAGRFIAIIVKEKIEVILKSIVLDIGNASKKGRKVRQVKRNIVKINAKSELCQEKDKDEYFEIHESNSKEAWKKKSKRAKYTYFTRTPTVVKKQFTAAPARRKKRQTKIWSW